MENIKGISLKKQIEQFYHIVESAKLLKKYKEKQKILQDVIVHRCLTEQEFYESLNLRSELQTVASQQPANAGVS